MRKRNSSKRTSKPEATPVVTGTSEHDAAPVAVVIPKPAPVRIGGFTLGNINRTAATVVAQRTHYGASSNRDEAYLALFATCAGDAERTPDGETISLAALASYGTNHFYTGSAKPHDAGAINRAIKAGNAKRADDGRSIVLTDAGKQLARNVLGKLAKPASEPTSEPAAE